MDHVFGQRRVYYNNFAEHLLNSYNPNMTHDRLPYCWSDRDWTALIEMLEAFGYNVFQYWLTPRLFCREGLTGEFGHKFTRQMNFITEQAHRHNLKVEFLCSLSTVGSEWHTLCPGIPSEWEECRYLWREWLSRLSGTDIVGIFPGDPGACSRHGCTALTFIDRANEIAALVKRHLPHAQIDLGTWGPPIFGWGIIQGPEGWQGEFIQKYQHTAWTFDKHRADETMAHLLKRLPDFPADTIVSINLGFNPDGIPNGDQDARPWARQIAATNPIQTWDFSLTEGENAILPHYRFQRLFEQRRRERDAAPYSGGICYTMTPRLNQLSLYEAAQSFIRPDDDYSEVAREFYRQVFGPGTEELVEHLPLFEIIKDWGNHLVFNLSREEYHGRMNRLAELLRGLENRLTPTIPFFPTPEIYRRELLFFAEMFAMLSGPAPDYDRLAGQYWQRVYAIYDQLPAHVDPRPHQAARKIIDFFRSWKGTALPQEHGPANGQWV